MKFGFSLRNLYLYSFSAAGLIMVLIAIVSLINIFLSVYIFPNTGYSWSSYTPGRDQCFIDVPAGDTYTRKPCSDAEYEKRNIEDEEKSKKDRKNDINRELAQSTALLIVGLPLLGYHWSVVKKDAKEEVA